MVRQKSSRRTKAAGSLAWSSWGCGQYHGIQISMGGERVLAGQRIRGTILENHQIRGGLSGHLRERLGCAPRLGALSKALQPDQTASGA